MSLRSLADTPRLADEATQLADQWNNKRVLISGRLCGNVYVSKIDDNVFLKNNDPASVNKFIVRASPEVPGAVSFEVDEPRKANSAHPRFLTVDLYGDEARRDASRVLAEVSALLPDHISTIVEFAIGQPTDSINFEGPGFNYAPLKALESAKPTKLQLFELVAADSHVRTRRFGVKSLFGSYWRCQHWTGDVSQSNHMLEDEIWIFRELGPSTT